MDEVLCRISAAVDNCCVCQPTISILSSSMIQAQSQGAITFKVVPGVKEELPIKEPKVGPVLAKSLCW